jgi:hypothetical protein
MYENGRKLGHAPRATPALWLLPFREFCFLARRQTVNVPA